jgi:hypothetical protein
VSSFGGGDDGVGIGFPDERVEAHGAERRRPEFADRLSASDPASRTSALTPFRRHSTGQLNSPAACQAQPSLLGGDTFRSRCGPRAQVCCRGSCAAASLARGFSRWECGTAPSRANSAAKLVEADATADGHRWPLHFKSGGDLPRPRAIPRNRPDRAHRPDVWAGRDISASAAGAASPSRMPRHTTAAARGRPIRTTLRARMWTDIAYRSAATSRCLESSERSRKQARTTLGSDVRRCCIDYRRSRRWSD